MNELLSKLQSVGEEKKDGHKLLCDHLRELTFELFTTCKKGNSGIYHAIDSFEREPELLKRIEKLENELKLIRN
ncbi:hypothetical protein PAECIP111891_06705 [Paenibacillus allorhizoplanae]|uniref:Group-specific protein n=1 Tax=Paenibacillus allorhizoplanae TaxID=2905648 RepID=A0ABN8H9T7_9BACL|nr:hypothetical protein [Paenibacillus allorhizoplanae]CAH1230635.1 hypothetical protein PAECIP111891_06705 [Paenibacillus allorhizoplanae]